MLFAFAALVAALAAAAPCWADGERPARPGDAAVVPIPRTPEVVAPASLSVRRLAVLAGIAVLAGALVVFWARIDAQRRAAE